MASLIRSNPFVATAGLLIFSLSSPAHSQCPLLGEARQFEPTLSAPPWEEPVAKADLPWFKAHASETRIISGTSETGGKEVTIEYQGGHLLLDEGPPSYQVQVQSIAGPLLFSRDSDGRSRVRIRNVERLVSHDDGSLSLDRLAEVSTPEWSECGFVLDGNENPTERVGIILPDLHLLTDGDRSQYSLLIQEKEAATRLPVPFEQWRNVPVQQLEEHAIVFMAPENLDRSRVRVVWLHLDSKGTIESRASGQ